MIALHGRRAADRLETHLAGIQLQAERMFATLRFGGLLAGVLVVSPAALAGMLPLVMGAGLFVALSALALAYAGAYAIWSPYERFDRRRIALTATLIDLVVVLFYILNTGGMASPVWMSVPLLVLHYSIRFGMSRREASLGVLVILAMVAATQVVVPSEVWILALTTVATLTISFLTARLASVLMDQERKAARRAMEAETRAMSLMVRTLQHDVNNPLAILSGNLELLELNEPDPSRAPYLSRIREALQRINAAVERLEELKDDPGLRETADVWAYIKSKTDDWEDEGL